MPERLDRASSFQATARYATNSHKGSKGVSKDSELSDGRRLPKETRRQPESSFRVFVFSGARKLSNEQPQRLQL